ncbi:hypothetical protein ACKS0A_06851 [Histoplasma ohiense]
MSSKECVFFLSKSKILLLHHSCLGVIGGRVCTSFRSPLYLKIISYSIVPLLDLLLPPSWNRTDLLCLSIDCSL